MRSLQNVTQKRLYTNLMSSACTNKFKEDGKLFFQQEMCPRLFETN